MFDIKEFGKKYPTYIQCDTPDCSLAWSGGRTAYVLKTHTCTTDEDDKVHNLFSVSGGVRILAIWCYISEATNVADFEEFKIQADDGTNQDDLCLATNLDDIPIGSLLLKDEDGTELTKLLADEVRYSESDSKQKVFTEGKLLQKYGTATYIRSIFNGSEVDCDMLWVVRWSPLTSTSSITAV